MRWLAAGALIATATAGQSAAQTVAPPGLTLAPYEAPTQQAEFGDYAPLSKAAFDTGKALKSEWRTGETAWRRESGSVDRLTLSINGVRTGADGLPSLRPDDSAAFEAGGFDLSLTRDWPSALSIDTGDGGSLEITPHAGVALTDAGTGAQAGATVSLEDKVAGRLAGVVRDGAEFGDRGRWYLFAATSGRSVGLNMLRGADGEMQRAGWSTDLTSALVSDAQAGIGWRRGPVQASLGYLHREIKPRNGLMGMETQDDELIAFSFSLKPR